MSAPVIRVRLTAIYAATIAAIMLLSTGALYRVLSTALDQEFERSVASSLMLARNFFRLETHEYQSVEPTVAHIAAELVVPDRRIEFIRPSGDVFVVPPSQLREGIPPLTPPLRVIEQPLDPAIAPGWRIRLHASEAELDRLHRRLTLWLAVSVPAVTLLAIAVGWWVTGRTLRPVGEMARATERIGGTGSLVRLPIANSRDEIGRLGTRFNALLDRLEDALSQQRRFLADAEHELRTPVARMRNAVDLALLDPAGHSDRATLEAVGRDLHRTSFLLGELLLLARADTEPPEPRRERYFLDDIVLDALIPWRGAAANAGIALTTSRMEETPAFLEPALLERLVGILVDNSIRYTPRGGAIDVRVFPNNGAATLEVADTGIGISPSDRPRIFERFYRTPDARRAAPDGSGLGLSIAYWIAERHNGTITLEPREGGGTVVRVGLSSESRVKGGQ
jgi:signal transduction histidine kinase